MEISATEAKNRLGQVLQQAQLRPVVIAKSGRRHSVLMSAAHYDALVAAAEAGRGRGKRRADAGRAFYARHKAWVDALNAEVAEQGLWNDGLRVW